jgi:succinoglycan biosynthesis protein ExoW
VQTISVIIPYFQREPGILTRALDSIHSQQIPPGWCVEVIVVDDGSAHPADEDVRALNFSAPLRLKVIRQERRGVSAARNRGLDEADPSATLNAFLDSDDSWAPLHVANAIEAYERGFDFIFSDNRREPYHDSYLKVNAARTDALLKQAKDENGFIEVVPSEMQSLVIEEFPAHISTLVYRRSVDPDLRFNEDLDACGEDKLFIMAVVSKAKRICFSARTIVECGRGVNIFFTNDRWDSPYYMGIQQNQLRCHTLISELPGLSEHAFACSVKAVRNWRNNFTFHTVRRMLASNGKFPEEARRLVKIDRGFLVWFPLSLLRLALGHVLGTTSHPRTRRA